MRNLLILGILLLASLGGCRKDRPATTPQNPPEDPAVNAPEPDVQPIRKLLDERKYEEALAKTDEGLKAHPDHGDLLFLRGIALFNLQRHEEALSVFESVRQKHALTPELVLALSETLFYLKRFDDCERVLREAMAKFPKNAALWYNLGGIYAEKGNWEEAARMYGEALLRQPDFAPALISAGDVAYRQGNLAKAREHFEKLSGIKGQETLAHLKLAVVDMKEKKWDAARGHLDEVKAQEPQHPELARLETALDAARLFDDLSAQLNGKRCKEARATLKTIGERHAGHPMLPKADEALKKACPK